MICHEVCPDKVEYYKRIKNLSIFFDTKIRILLWINCLFLAVGWAMNLEYPPISKILFYGGYFIIFMTCLFIEYYWLHKEDKYNIRKFGLTEVDMLEEYRLLKENLPSISKEEMLTR